MEFAPGRAGHSHASTHGATARRTMPIPSRIIAGAISRITNARDAKWGMIHPRGFSREVFFTSADLEHPEDFELLAPGHPVEFEEQPDRGQGMRAVNLKLVRQAEGQP